MGHLGKLVKGRAKRPDQKRIQIKIRNLDRSAEDIVQEQLKLKDRKNHL